MKPPHCLCLLIIIAFCACTKNTAGIRADNAGGVTGGWRLAQKQTSIAQPVAQIIIPPANQGVTLLLNSDSTYSTRLNGQLAAQGQYSISIDSAYFNTPVLQLNNFTTTGIFNLFPEAELDSNGQVISIYTGLYMNATSDTLTLKTPYMPGGYIGYTFVRN